MAEAMSRHRDPRSSGGAPHLACATCMTMNVTDPCYRCGRQNSHEITVDDANEHIALQEARDALTVKVGLFWGKVCETAVKHR